MALLQKISAACSTCGEPLTGKGVCLFCLLRAGLEGSLDNATRAFGDFEIARREDGSFWELGRGAMGVTYRAVDKVLHRHVALKVIESPAPGAGSQVARKRFLREACNAAALQHPNVASVFHFGALPETERCYLAMELVDGETLEARVHREGPLAVADVIEIAFQVTRALVAAGARGLIHRDLKPGNIMIAFSEEHSSASVPLANRRDATGTVTPLSFDPPSPMSDGTSLVVKVIDFGLAKAAADAAAETNPTREGFVGTPAFASPEQFGNNSVDSRSDIYSLGITLWYAFTGRLPFPGRNAKEIRDQQVRDELPVEALAARRVPAPLIALLRSMLARDPAQRPASARDLLARLESCRAKLARPNESAMHRRWAAVLALALIIAAGALVFRALLPPSEQSFAPEKSIAVLPFENLSKREENAFFAAGIQDDLLTSLAQIHDLKVISRTSVMAYKPGGRNMREIGQALGVANALEGSVRKSGDRILVNVRLVDTRTDQELWANHYDNRLVDSPSLQGQLANEIATALKATVSPDEMERLQKKKTSNPQAYEAYLRGLAAEELGPWKFSDLQNSVRAFSEAVQLDPGFAPAWAKLSIMQSSIYWMGYDQTAPRLAEAKKALDKVSALDPDAGQFYLARGYYHYWGEKNYEAAARDFAQATKRLPNSADALLALGLIDRRLGHWEDALAHMAQAAILNPRDRLLFDAWGITLNLLRKFDEQRALLERRLESTPNDNKLVIAKAWSYQEEGDLERAARLLRPLPLEPANSPLRGVQDAQLLYERQFQQLIERQQTLLRRADLSARNRGFYLAGLGQVQMLAGDHAARSSFLEARVLLEQERERTAFDLDVANSLAFVYAYLGDKEAALHEAERALALAANDALTEPSQQVLLAQIHAQFGDADAALRDLPRLLQTPASGITPGRLRFDPIWDPIRKDPRFEKMLAALKPNITASNK